MRFSVLRCCGWRRERTQFINEMVLQWIIRRHKAQVSDNDNNVHELSFFPHTSRNGQFCKLLERVNVLFTFNGADSRTHEATYFNCNEHILHSSRNAQKLRQTRQATTLERDGMSDARFIFCLVDEWQRVRESHSLVQLPGLLEINCYITTDQHIGKSDHTHFAQCGKPANIAHTRAYNIRMNRCPLERVAILCGSNANTKINIHIFYTL